MNTRSAISGSRFLTAVVVSALLLLQPIAAAAAEQTPKITEEEAYAIGMHAYLYFYSLVTMDVTRKQFTNIEPNKELGKGPMNMFVNVSEYPPGDFRGVVRANFDTLYSIRRRYRILLVDNSNL